MQEPGCGARVKGAKVQQAGWGARVKGVKVQEAGCGTAFIDDSSRPAPLGEPVQGGRPVDELVALDSHALQHGDVEIAERS